MLYISGFLFLSMVRTGTSLLKHLSLKAILPLASSDLYLTPVLCLFCFQNLNQLCLGSLFSSKDCIILKLLHFALSLIFKTIFINFLAGSSTSSSFQYILYGYLQLPSSFKSETLFKD